MSDERTMKLPNRETYLANWIIKTLREWRSTHRAMCNGHAPNLPLADMDIDQLEECCKRLVATWDSTSDAITRSGFHVIEQQPSIRDTRERR